MNDLTRDESRYRILQVWQLMNYNLQVTICYAGPQNYVESVMSMALTLFKKHAHSTAISVIQKSGFVDLKASMRSKLIVAEPLHSTFELLSSQSLS